MVGRAPIDSLRKSESSVSVVGIYSCSVGIDIGSNNTRPAIVFEISDCQRLGLRASAINVGEAEVPLTVTQGHADSVAGGVVVIRLLRDHGRSNQVGMRVPIDVCNAHGRIRLPHRNPIECAKVPRAVAEPNPDETKGRRRNDGVGASVAIHIGHEPAPG